MSLSTAIQLVPRRVAATAFVLGAIALAGCGSSSSSTNTSSNTGSSASAPRYPSTTSSAANAGNAAPTSKPAATGASTLALEANPEGQLMFSTKSLSAKPGKVTIDFTNTSSLEHNLTVASSSGTVVGATPTFRGGTKTLVLNLQPGVYKFYCSVPGHREAGMEGTLTVS